MHAYVQFLSIRFQVFPPAWIDSKGDGSEMWMVFTQCGEGPVTGPWPLPSCDGVPQNGTCSPLARNHYNFSMQRITFAKQEAAAVYPGSG